MRLSNLHDSCNFTVYFKRSTVTIERRLNDLQNMDQNNGQFSCNIFVKTKEKSILFPWMIHYVQM